LPELARPDIAVADVAVADVALAAEAVTGEPNRGRGVSAAELAVAFAGRVGEADRCGVRWAIEEVDESWERGRARL
jgi:hypothetical protein